MTQTPPTPPSPPVPPSPPHREPGRSRRGRSLLLLALVLAVGGAGWAGYWDRYLKNVVSTDDAYVAGDIVQITNEVAGTVMALHVDDTQRVRRGDPLLELDPADAQIALGAAEAGLGQAVRQVRSLYAQAVQQRAQIVEREAALRQAQDDLKRRATLAASGGVSAEELAHGRDTITQLAAALDAARGLLDQTTAQIAGTTTETHPLVLSAAARLRDAALALRRTRILAPVDGVVARRGVQLGQRLAPGTPLMAVVPLEDVWVDANFKEVQLDRLRTGQPVTLSADLYGRDVVYHGVLAGLAAGSGAAFALLPAQNATGNWIKIVQRLPVRITLDAAEIKGHPLRIGLSMVVTVDVREQSGAPVTTPLRARPLPANLSQGDDPGISARIAKIISENSAGTPGPVKGNPS